MRVLSLFDGIGGAFQALLDLGVYPSKYYASEIDKFAITIAKKNHDSIIHIGDIKGISGFKNIDLLIGGSPCQGFSMAGNKLNLKDEKSALFFEYLRVLKETKPKYFILENVAMVEKYQNIISNLLGVQPILINSNLLTAQNRKRLYWTNIKGVSQPEDRGIILRDILTDADFNREITKDIKKDRKILCNNNPSNRGHNGIVYNINRLKCPTVTINKGEGIKFGDPDIKKWRTLTPVECERLQGFKDDYTKGISNAQRYKVLGNSFTVPVISHILKNIKYLGEIKCLTN